MSIFGSHKTHKTNGSCTPCCSCIPCCSCKSCCSCRPCKYAVRVELERLRREYIHAENALRTYGNKIERWNFAVENTPEENREYIRLVNISKDTQTAYEDYKRFADSIYRQG